MHTAIKQYKHTHTKSNNNLPEKKAVVHSISIGGGT